MSATVAMKRQGWVAAFGKHPGWNDHIDDIGLVTPGLITFKRLLYFEGLATNIDAGTWDRLSPEHRLKGLGHSFLSVSGGCLIVGRLWGSRDGKGRAHYPMVICIQMENVGVSPSLAIAMPLLVELEMLCRTAESATAVQGAITEIQRRLSTDLVDETKSDERMVSDLLSFARLANWAEGMQPYKEGLGFQRLCHRINRDFVGFRQYVSSSRDQVTLFAQHLRVPAGDDSDERSFLLWFALLRKNLPDSVPLLLFRPFDRNWLDILVGIPRAEQFAFLLSDHDAIPYVTEVPYTLDQDAYEKSQRMLSVLRSEPESGMQMLWQIPPREKESKLVEWWQQVHGIVNKNIVGRFYKS